MQPALLVYSPEITPRLRYITGFVLGGILGAEAEPTDDRDRFDRYDGPRINYSSDAGAAGIHIRPHGLLFQKGIREQDVPFSMRSRGPVLFPASGAAALPFDIFSAAFYLVSRYEEYLPHTKDGHDRFEAAESLAHRKGFLDRPVVDEWAYELGALIADHYPGYPAGKRAYRYLSTIDVDNAYAYLEKGLIRTMGGYLRSLATFDLREAGLRSRVLLGLEKDPYDTYDIQFDIQKRYGLRPVYFFLVADYGLNDKNVSIYSRRFQSLMKNIADYAGVGLHPSFASARAPQKLAVELRRLSGVLNREITRSRQHFLKFRLPGTYRHLIDMDIREEYSMGFATRPGFRAGTCTPFPFYDLDRETETPLKVFPFAVMDATLRYYMNINPSAAMDTIRPLIGRVKSVNGTFISLWHNESLSENRIWRGWRNVYEALVREATAQP